MRPEGTHQRAEPRPDEGATAPAGAVHPTKPPHLRPHTLVASILAPDTAAAVAALARMPSEVGLAEVRLDGLWPQVPDIDRATDDLLALTDTARVPLLATLRPVRQGGKFQGPEDVRLSLLQAALRAGFAAADLEVEGPDPAARIGTLRPYGAVVASSHLPDTPCRSDGMQALLAMQDLGVAYDKLAFVASAFPDLLRALEFAHAHAARGGRPSVSTLVHGGAPTRALLALAGNRATYAAAPGLPPAAPGQPSVDDLLAVWRHWGISPADLDACAAGGGHWFAVIGHPVGHSLSPRLHNAALRAAGRPERFGALDVPASASALRLAFHAAERIGLRGASITAPHKVDAARVAECDEAARAIGAANCVRIEAGGRVLATNTDASAVARLAKGHVKPGSSALVLGSGGFARAATSALKSLGAHVVVVGRDEGKAAAFHALGATLIPWADRAKAPADAIVQATPLTDASVLPSTSLDNRPWVLEAVYADGPTALQRAAEEAGAVVVDGRRLLLAQAEDAYRFWTGGAPDADAMRKALA